MLSFTVAIRKKRPLIPGEGHHWWPKSLSQYWTDHAGLISRIDTDGKVSRSKPFATGKISDGHNIRLGNGWDTTFEQDFDRPDNNFPIVVNFLESLVRSHCEKTSLEKSCQCAHACTESDLQQLCECLVSLAVRSPHFRHRILRTALDALNNVPKERHKILIGANVMQAYRRLIGNNLGRGKFLVLFSRSKEFIFGDGFYSHNLTSMSSGCRILVPLTPLIAVLYILPGAYMVNPRLVTQEAIDEVIPIINETVQVYSKECLFYRFERPFLSEHFLRREHLYYSNGDPVEMLIEQMPGAKMPQWPL